ncbi:hypothetical protein WMY93_000600 [Mugilogobius chulae]|uniref:EF-hand domain-containing protein n=1 Tax=Mugilogobius chulae TaxID=88201 RepID=A0AAW0Q2I5_9GOBI
MDQFRGLFDKLDQNNDGYISKGELHNEMKKHGILSADGKVQDGQRRLSDCGLDGVLTSVIINPVENIGELVSSWKHNVVFDVGESRAMPMEFSEDPGVWGRFVLSAGLADAVSRTMTAPIDRLKTQLQVHGSKAFSQGFQELRSGGMKTYTQDQTRDSLTVQQRFTLGCVSGAVAHAAFYPLEVLKVRLNLLQAGTYSGVVAYARSIYTHESVSSFYRGFKPSLLCMIPYAGVECAVHQSIMNWAKNNPDYNSESQLFFFSFVAFASGQMTSYPLAVIRTHQQAAAFYTSRRSAGVLNGLLDIYERNGLRGGEVEFRMNEVRKIWGGMKRVFECRSLGMDAKRRLYEGVVVPAALYGAETWSLKVAEKRKLNVMEMMPGVQLRGRPRMGWMDGVRRWLNARGTTVTQGREAAIGMNGERLCMREEDGYLSGRVRV